MERTLILVKPDAMRRNAGGAILNKFQSQGIKIVGMKMLHVDETLARKHYEAHVEKPFFPELLKYITSTPIIAAVLEADGVIEKARKIMGSTDPAKAEAGTIRKEFGLNIQENAVHGSDSPEAATREINLYFKPTELFKY